MCAIRFGEFLKSSINGEHLSYRDIKPKILRVLCCVFWWVFTWFRSGSTCSSESVPPSFALQINFLPHPLLHLICCQQPIRRPPLPPTPLLCFLSPHPTSTPMRQPRPDNDVLITRLLGCKIALSLIHMQWNICHRLGTPPPPPPPPPLCGCRAG